CWRASAKSCSFPRPSICRSNDALLEASEFVRLIQHRQGLLVGCPEEIAYAKGFIGADTLRTLAARYGKTAYGRYLQQLLDEPSSLRKKLETEPLSSQMRVEFWRWIELWSLRSAVDYAATSLGMRIRL